MALRWITLKKKNSLIGKSDSNCQESRMLSDIPRSLTWFDSFALLNETAEMTVTRWLIKYVNLDGQKEDEVMPTYVGNVMKPNWSYQDLFNILQKNRPCLLFLSGPIGWPPFKNNQEDMLSFICHSSGAGDLHLQPSRKVMKMSCIHARSIYYLFSPC